MTLVAIILAAGFAFLALRFVIGIAKFAVLGLIAVACLVFAYQSGIV